MLTKTRGKNDGDRVKITEVLITQYCAFFQWNHISANYRTNNQKFDWNGCLDADI